MVLGILSYLGFYPDHCILEPLDSVTVLKSVDLFVLAINLVPESGFSQETDPKGDYLSIYRLKKLTHMISGGWQVWICRTGQEARHSCESWCFSLGAEGWTLRQGFCAAVWRPNSFLFRIGLSLLFRPSTDWMRPSHIIICFAQSQLISMLITSKKYLHSNIQSGVGPNTWTLWPGHVVTCKQPACASWVWPLDNMPSYPQPLVGAGSLMREASPRSLGAAFQKWDCDIIFCAC